MAHIRTYRELLAARPTMVERRLIRAAKIGEPCILSDGNLPPEGPADPAREIRAAVLRYLMLGGCDGFAVDTIGVRLEGASIIGILGLDHKTIWGGIHLVSCTFDQPVTMQQTTCGQLEIRGSRFPNFFGKSMNITGDAIFSDIVTDGTININSASVGGHFLCDNAQLSGSSEAYAINAYAAQIKVGFFLRNTTTQNTILLSGASIGGQLNCTGAQLKAVDDFALKIQGATVTDLVFLHPRTPSEQKKVKNRFVADGGVSLTGSSIGGLYAENTLLIAAKDKDALDARNLTVKRDVRLLNCSVAGEVRFAGARITGDLNCNGASFQNYTGHAFNGQRMRVEQSFIWRNVQNYRGQVSLNGAHVVELDDSPDNWPDEGSLMLDGFTYDRIKGKVSTSPARDDWLRNGSLHNKQFFPQPYTQYAKFLRDTGHDTQARRVLLSRETLVKKYERKELHWASVGNLGFFRRPWRGFWDRLQWLLVGHGHTPFWSILWLVVLIFAATFPANRAWEEGSFAPNSAPILVSEKWRNLHTLEKNPASVWSGDTAPKDWKPLNIDTTGWDKEKLERAWRKIAPGRDWETFNRYAYAADIVIPLIDFGQTDAWAPSTTRLDAGWHLWWLRWVFTVLGWIVTALGASAITGIIRRD